MENDTSLENISHKCNNEVNKNSHEILIMTEICELTKLLVKFVNIEKKRVLLVSDIDDTLIRPVVNIGSDAWFRYSLKNEDIADVINKLSIIYAVIQFQGVENDTDILIDTIKDLSDPLKYQNSLKYMCLTARNVRFHSYTTMHLHRMRYDKVLVRRNMLELSDNSAMYLMGADKGNENVPLVRYIDNICSTSGENKGEVLVEILSKYFDKQSQLKEELEEELKEELKEEFDLIIFIDDLKENIDKVHNQLKTFTKKNFSSMCIHYTYMEEHKNNYSIHHFTDDTTKMDHLIKLKHYINENH